MTPLSREILENFQVRQGRKQQTVFFSLLQARYPHMQTRFCGFPRRRVLIFGDPENARLLLTSRYTNLSGVITLCELMELLDSREKGPVAFVLFHREKPFLSQYKHVLSDKLVMDIHQVSQGDTLMLAMSKKARETYRKALDRCFCPTKDKGILLTRLEKTSYPRLSPRSVAVATRTRRPLFGYYAAKKHISKDDFDPQTIKLLCEGIRKFIQDLRSSLWN